MGDRGLGVVDLGGWRIWATREVGGGWRTMVGHGGGGDVSYGNNDSGHEGGVRMVMASGVVVVMVKARVEWWGRREKIWVKVMVVLSGRGGERNCGCVKVVVVLSGSGGEKMWVKGGSGG